MTDRERVSHEGYHTSIVFSSREHQASDQTRHAHAPYTPFGTDIDTYIISSLPSF